jgi:hypothetical protein
VPCTTAAAAAAAAGFSEYMGFLVLNGSNDSVPLVPMQRSGRKVQLAAISSNKVGKAIQVRCCSKQPQWRLAAVVYPTVLSYQDWQPGCMCQRQLEERSVDT